MGLPPRMSGRKAKHSFKNMAPGDKLPFQAEDWEIMRALAYRYSKEGPHAFFVRKNKKKDEFFGYVTCVTLEEYQSVLAKRGRPTKVESTPHELARSLLADMELLIEARVSRAMAAEEYSAARRRVVSKIATALGGRPSRWCN